MQTSKNTKRWRIGTRFLAALSIGVLAAAQVAFLSAQSSRSSYGGSRPLWWSAGQGDFFAREDDFDNATGQLRVLETSGLVNTKDHPFFEALGLNGRACVTCHQPFNAMSVSAETLRQRWIETKGKDPVFAAVDGSNCPDRPQAEERSHSLLLERGLFRIALPWPPKSADGAAVKPEFRIEVVNDPTGCNTGKTYGLESASPAVSVYRRPRVAANLLRVAAGPEGLILMADAREPTLRSQAISAAIIHEQAATPTEQQLSQIVDFETHVYLAQRADSRAGLLNEENAPSPLGPEKLAEGRANTLAGGTEKLDNAVWRSFDVWRQPPGADPGLQLAFRDSIARGSDVFFSRRFHVSGVAPLDVAGSAAATCASCHSPQANRWVDIGTANRSNPRQSTAELPLFRITCDASAAPHPVFGRVIYTQDPGRALVTGKCADVGAVVMQQFHGLAARAPYFANGSALTLRELVEFYDHKFQIQFTEREKNDLVHFLGAL